MLLKKGKKEEKRGDAGGGEFMFEMDEVEECARSVYNAPSVTILAAAS